ncbi:hypothetical protein [Paractinoplanes brasiliensis]|uniref:Uncharacterized protein n=1 Tax=Paractinoplanes brasiliensis TaxID=52695 RepID=A0A4V3C7W9_9ACTN|nr:hypothetical protein [Actinoplanes brasiliensis]TDO39308.1 hypothetical protein C8E87_2989 [Actinoplanes brasiliensis]GID32673.1 hypothetical protein Abr02nite_76560 [Actinoplanes brasiliensis]
MNNQIIICDDETDRAMKWADFLEKIPDVADTYAVSTLSDRGLAQAIGILEARRRSARGAAEKDQHSKREALVETPFDSAAMVIVDYDLIDLRAEGDQNAYAGPSETGERVAYLARCYSRCDTIVALNQFVRQSTFDLRLRGHLSSYADLNIASDDLMRPTLWLDDQEGYRPWSWPCLGDAPARHRARVEFVEEHMDEPILAALGILSGEARSPAYEAMQREHLEFLSRDVAETATFRDFVVNSGKGLRARDELWEPQAAARIAAARVHKWLERDVLPGQDILVDGPHLALRYPSLIGSTDTDAALRHTTRRTADGESVGLLSETIAYAAFPHPNWLSRPCWFWPSLANDERIVEVGRPWEAADISLVFCEDASDFRIADSAREFRAEVLGPFGRRYVAGLDGISYEPAVRFAL